MTRSTGAGAAPTTRPGSGPQTLGEVLEGMPVPGCSVADCAAPHLARGLCRKHYARQRRHGSPEPGNTRAHSREQVLEKIASRTLKTKGGCWEWQGAVGPNGYGYSSWAGQKLAHRMSFEAHIGPIPIGMHLDHLCRNRRCVNPTHLEPVTPLVNQRRKPDETRKRPVCRKGHEISGDNVIASRGARRCRICREQYLVDWRAGHEVA